MREQREAWAASQANYGSRPCLSCVGAALRRPGRAGCARGMPDRRCAEEQGGRRAALGGVREVMKGGYHSARQYNAIPRSRPIGNEGFRGGRRDRGRNPSAILRRSRLTPCRGCERCCEGNMDAKASPFAPKDGSRAIRRGVGAIAGVPQLDCSSRQDCRGRTLRRPMAVRLRRCAKRHDRVRRGWFAKGGYGAKRIAVQAPPEGAGSAGEGYLAVSDAETQRRVFGRDGPAGTGVARSTSPEGARLAVRRALGWL